MPALFQLHSHGFPNSPALEAAARESAQALDNDFDRLQECHVFVTTPNHHHAHGKDFEVRIELTLPPRRRISVAPRPEFPGQFKDAYVAVREAFRLLRKDLLREIHRRPARRDTVRKGA